MKKLFKVLFVFAFSMFVFWMPSKADFTFFATKQNELNAKVLELLESNNLAKLEEYLNNIPDCLYSEESQNSDICTFDRIDGKDFVAHALQGSFRKEPTDFPVVSLDEALYSALKNIYSSYYQKSPKTLNIKNYRNFYNRYKDTWLNDRVEKILIKIWQRGDFLSKYNSSFSCVNGESVYTTIYISYMLDFDRIYKYSSSEISFNTSGLSGGRGRLHTILNEMKRKSDATHSSRLLKVVVKHWFDSLISPEEWDKTEQEYYKGKKQQRMYDMFNEEGWDMFAEAGLTPTDWQKHTITLYVQSCRRVIKDEKKCSAFEEGATKYGFYIPPEVIEKQINEQFEKQLTAALERKAGYFDKGYLHFK